MMIVFFFKPNINTLMQANKKFVDVFYKVLQEEVWESSKARANMDYVFKIIQYFMLCDIAASVRNIIKYNLPYYLLGNIEIFSARLTLGSLIIPGDIFFKIPQSNLEDLYSYLRRTKFFSFFIKMYCNFSQREISSYISDLGRSEIMEALGLPDNEHGGRKNPFLNIYHSFFNVKLLLRNHKQLEDFIDPRINIDRVNLKVKKLTGSKRFSQRFSTLLDISGPVKSSQLISSLIMDGGETSAGLRPVMVHLTTINRMDS